MITVVGMDGSALSPQAGAALGAATLVAGARRHLAAVPVLTAPSRAQTIVLGELAPALDALAAHDGDAVVLASGDPGFFGIVRALRERGLTFTVLPAVSSVALAFARAGLAWDDAVVVSAHGRDPRPAVNVCRAYPKVAVLTGPGCGPAKIGVALAGWDRRLVVAEHLGSDAERLTECSPADAARRAWDDPNVVLVLGAGPGPRAAHPSWMADWCPSRGINVPFMPERAVGWALAEEEFDSRDAVMTKAEVRALALARIGPGPGMLVWDVGAGSGSVAVECARFGAAVIAVEREAVRCERIQANASRHGVDVRVVPGEAPGALERLPGPDAVFVGGGGPAVLAAVAARGPARIVVALAAVERAGPAIAALDAAGYATEGALMQAARFAPLPGDVHRLAATNPVFLVWATAGPAATEPVSPAGARSPGPGGTETITPGDHFGLIAVTMAGHASAARLAEAWPGETRSYDGPARQALHRAWAECDGLVCFLAVGATTRLVAPLLDSKWFDPAVVCVDEPGRYAVTLVGGHAAGANALCTRVADVLGAQAIITTATDATGLPGLDTLGWPAEGAIARVSRALLDGEPVGFEADETWPLPPFPVTADASGQCRIVVTDRIVPIDLNTVVLRPPSLAAGVGASKGVTSEEVLGLLDEALAVGGLSRDSVTALATVNAKAGEEGIVAAARQGGWPLHSYPASQLAAVPVPNPGDAAMAAVGTPSVAEAAALTYGDELVVAKRKSAMATVALARIRPRGRLALVGLGPGDRDLVTPRAIEELRRASVVVGLDRYLDQIHDVLRRGTRVLRSGLGDEEQRAASAVAEARKGHAVALVGSGDAGVYAMASPALAIAGADIDVAGVPGVTAGLAAAALLGAPLGHDHVIISLSDLHTPWEIIERRIRAAAAGDFVVAFYNPRSKERDWQLGAALEILAGHRDPGTPVGVVHDAFRPGQRVLVTTLAEIDPAVADMTSVVIVGSASTRIIAGRMVTPRGYRWQH